MVTFDRNVDYIDGYGMSGYKWVLDIHLFGLHIFIGKAIA